MNIADQLVLRPEWKELLEEFPERFVLGIDMHRIGPRTVTRYGVYLKFWRGLRSQLSKETQVKIAHQNAERLLKLQATR